MTSTLSPAGPAAAPPAAATCPAPARPRLRAVSYEPAPGTTAAPVRARPDPPPVTVGAVEAPPGARDAIVRLLRLGCEVLDGRRPAGQLAAHSAEEVVRYWRVVAARRPGGGRSPARFRRVRLCHPRPDAAEAALAVELDGQVRALAARFDLQDGRWRWTAVRIG